MTYSHLNNRPRLLVLFVLTLFLFLSSCTEQSTWQQHNESNAATIDHQDWQNILDEYLVEDESTGINLVDYQSLSEEALPELNMYLDTMANINIRDYNRSEQFAYWVNLYNAITVQLVAKNYPVDSIKNISEGVLPLGPWNDGAIEISGIMLTLNDIEHEILRSFWQDYRIHFAVNCASMACPNLLAKAFTASNKEALLNRAAEEYLQHPRGFEILEGVLNLSSIFDWYQEDFGANETELLATLSQHFSDEQKKQLAVFNGEIEYRYDWALNSLE